MSHLIARAVQVLQRHRLLLRKDIDEVISGHVVTQASAKEWLRDSDMSVANWLSVFTDFWTQHEGYREYMSHLIARAVQVLQVHRLLLREDNYEVIPGHVDAQASAKEWLPDSDMSVANWLSNFTHFGDATRRDLEIVCPISLIAPSKCCYDTGHCYGNIRTSRLQGMSLRNPISRIWEQAHRNLHWDFI